MTVIRPIIGQRRLRAVLEEPMDIADDIGGVTRSFQPRISLWISLEPLKGTERAEAGRGEAAISHRIVLRWRGDVTAAMRFSAESRLFAVRALLDPDGRKRNLVCLVEEVRP
jgi:SPP1 family predicted phage head-tail adaptor